MVVPGDPGHQRGELLVHRRRVHRWQGHVDGEQPGPRHVRHHQHDQARVPDVEEARRRWDDSRRRIGMDPVGAGRPRRYPCRRLRRDVRLGRLRGSGPRSGRVQSHRSEVGHLHDRGVPSARRLCLRRRHVRLHADQGLGSRGHVGPRRGSDQQRRHQQAAPRRGVDQGLGHR